MTLHIYFGRRFLVAFLGVFFALSTMLALIDMLEQVRRFDSDTVSFGAIVTLTLLNVPESIYRILPLVTILATLALFLALSRSSELVIARASGRSALTSIAAPVLVAIAIGGGAVAIFNPIVAATSKQYDTLANRYLQTATSVLSISTEGLWLRQGGPEGQTVIRASRANLDGTQLFDTTFLSFAPGGLPVDRIEAARATLTPGAWVLEDAKKWPLSGADNPELQAEEIPDLKIVTDLTRNQIIDSFGTPSAIPIWELPGFIEQLEKAGFSARQHRVWFQMELAMPLLLGAMVLVAAGFTLRPARFGQTGLMVVLALTLGFSLYFMRNFAQILGENGQIPVLLAAWGPPAAAVLLPLGLLLHLEDG
ncbi:MAG: LPS export ABC transporter permease LptG [Rhodobacteraceae bacterium]|nr:LPS export ABC transporter permease LptG [Paracoccaceae bacterium]